MDRHRQPKAEDAADIHAHRGGLLSKMRMEMALAFSLHPDTHHQRLGEVHQVHGQPLQVETTQTKHHRSAAKIAGKIPQQRLAVRSDRSTDSVRLDVIGVLGFAGLIGSKPVAGTIRRIDRGHVNMEIHLPKLEHLAQNERHRKGGILAYQICERTGRRRRGHLYIACIEMR